MSENSNMPMHQTLEQARAKVAWTLVKGVKQNDIGKYKTLVKRFPALVNHNGLGQSVSFLFAKKGDNAEGQLMAHLSQWLMQSNQNKDVSCYTPPYRDSYLPGTPGKLIECITNYDSRAYIQATREALMFLDYLRRFADGLSEEYLSKEK